MDRRHFLALAGAALLAPPQAHGQRSRSALIAYLTGGTRVTRIPLIAAFSQAMRDLGWSPGESFRIEARYAEGDFGRLPALARELLDLDPDIFLVSTTPASLAAKALVATKPIVMAAVADPVGSGLIESIARPGGNITGITNITAELAGKRLSILKDLLPGASKVAVLVNTRDANATLQLQSAIAAAGQLGVRLDPVLSLQAPSDVEPALIAAKTAGADAAMRMVDPLEAVLRPETVALALKHRLPIIYAFREAVEAGGLISYGTSQQDQYRQAATLVHKILNGARPADLPVERPVKFEMVINLKTAATMGIAVPATMLAAAETIE